MALQAGQELGLVALNWGTGEWTSVMSCDDVSADTCRETEFGETYQQRRLWRQARLRAWETGPHTRDEGWL